LAGYASDSLTLSIFSTNIFFALLCCSCIGVRGGGGLKCRMWNSPKDSVVFFHGLRLKSPW